MLRLTFSDGEVKEIIEPLELGLNDGFMVLKYSNGDVIIYPAHAVEEAMVTTDNPEVLEPDEIIIGETD